MRASEGKVVQQLSLSLVTITAVASLSLAADRCRSSLSSIQSVKKYLEICYFCNQKFQNIEYCRAWTTKWRPSDRLFECRIDSIKWKLLISVDNSSSSSLDYSQWRHVIWFIIGRLACCSPWHGVFWCQKQSEVWVHCFPIFMCKTPRLLPCHFLDRITKGIPNKSLFE